MAAEIKPLLDAAAFGNQPIDEHKEDQLVRRARAVIDRVADLAHDDHRPRSRSSLSAMPHQANDVRKPAGHASGFLRRLLVLALTLGSLLAGANAAHAQVRVEGQPDAVHIDARDVPLREVLDALQAKFNLRYRTSDVLDTRMTGTFNGSLRRVAVRVLEGYDFAMKITPRDIDVLILRQNGPDDKAVAAATPTRAMAKASPAPAMTAAQANRYERGQVR